VDERDGVHQHASRTSGWVGLDGCSDKIKDEN